MARKEMDAVVEAIGEYIRDALRNNEPEVAKGILKDIEMWYEDHLKKLYTAKELLRDSVFSSIYCCGYENIDWNDIRCSLEVYFCQEIEDALRAYHNEEIEYDDDTISQVSD